MPKKTEKKYTYAIGRRKSAIARTKLFAGKGESTVNNTLFSKYFTHSRDQAILCSPLDLTNNRDRYYFQIQVSGGGLLGQLEAAALSLSRCLKSVDEEYGKTLRAADLLTVDSRVRQRRMIGTGGKARRHKQSPKR